YSLLDGASRIDRLFDAVKAAGQSAVAITDHGVMYGVMDFYKKAKAAGVKPIIGCEVYVAPKSRFEKQRSDDKNYHHLILLCKNLKGYQNLIKMVSLGFTEGFYTRPRIDKELLKNHSEGLICLSACIAGEIPNYLLYGNYNKAKDTALEFAEIFGKENFYLELQNHGIKEQLTVNNGLKKISFETGIPLVCTNDVHYIEKQDSKMQEVLLAIGTGKKLDDEDLMSFETDEFYLKTGEQMASLFPDTPEAISNTLKIAEMCNVEFEFHKLKLPVFDIGEKNHLEYLREMSYKGLYRHYGENPSKEAINRLEYELSVIHKMGFVDYFLIVQDYVAFAKKKGIPVGPGRGSGAGSLVAYCVGITGIDPIKYGLLFERFLNPERVSMPDFDVDFCYVRRGEVIDYVISKYGADHVAQIVTFGTMAARAAVRDVGRVMGMPYNAVDRVAKLIPNELGITIDKAMEQSPDLKSLYDMDEETRTLIKMSKKIEGMPRHASTHAAGVVIADRVVSEYVPLALNDESIVTQFTMTELEELGLLKMDFLGLRNLTVISDAEKMIRKYEPDFNIENIPLDDNDTIKMMADGFTEGVFQFESEGMKNVLRSFGPENLEDLTAILSLYRPGPRKSIPTYIYNRHNPEKITYKTELLKPILNITYGCIVYQEQVMQIFRSLAGYSLGRADIVRRAMSKKKHDVMKRERETFIHGAKDEMGNIIAEGAVARGVPRNIAEEIYDDVALFSSYAFNKSHAAAYTVVAYQTAYLKCHYTREYMAALLSSVLAFGGKVTQYSAECARLGIKILPPDVNESNLDFTVSGKNIRFGMLAIKNLGAGFIKRIIELRSEKRFDSLYDFCLRMQGRDFNRRALEGLIKSGAMDSFGYNRRQMLQCLDLVINAAEQEYERSAGGQMSLFDDIEQSSGSVDISHIIPDLPEMPLKEILNFEKESTGLYLSGHPLDAYKGFARAVSAKNTKQVLEHEIKDSEKVSLVVLINDVKNKSTKKGDLMAFLTVEDMYDSISVTVFPKLHLKARAILNPGEIVHITGRVSESEDRPAEIICETLEPAKIIEDKASQFSKLYLRIPTFDEQILGKINLLLDNKGAEVIIYCEDTKQRFKAAKFANFKENSEKWQKLCDFLGEKNVKAVE
ncbi:MAG: DNA polymerase III subunit alpha, partial [Ruminococcaceae bacterium]|nr:DNA polymerase III subunit alpha [Oscillospiraceae bacterium]